MSNINMIPIYNKWTAVRLNEVYHIPVMGIRENNKIKGELVFFFERTDELVKLLREQFDIKVN